MVDPFKNHKSFSEFLDDSFKIQPLIKENFSFVAAPLDQPMEPPVNDDYSPIFSKVVLKDILREVDEGPTGQPATKKIKLSDINEQIEVDDMDENKDLDDKMIKESDQSQLDVYPDHIDFLDDLSEGFNTVNMSRHQASIENKSKRVTIKSLNTSSVVLNRIGEHNMSYNQDKGCWDDNDHDMGSNTLLLCLIKGEERLGESFASFLSLADNEMISSKDDHSIVTIDSVVSKSMSTHSKSMRVQEMFDELNLINDEPSFKALSDRVEEDDISTSILSVVSNRADGMNALEAKLALLGGKDFAMMNHVDLSDSKLQSTIDIASHFPCLTAIDIFTNLTCLSHLINLRQLDISNNQLSDLSALSSLTQLQELTAMDNTIADCKPLSGMASLVAVNLKGNLITELPFAFSSLTNLTHLNVSHNALVCFGGIDSLTSLQEINASNQLVFYQLSQGGNIISRMSLKRDMIQLRVVRLDKNALDMFDCRHLVAIQSLNVDSNNLGPFIHEYTIETLTHLSAESQSNNELININLKQFPNLKELRVSNNTLTKLLPITRIKSIKGVFAVRCGLNSLDSLFSRHSLKHIQKLDLSGNPIQDISKLAEATRLTGLWLNGCSLDSLSHVLSVLKRFKALKTLDLRYALLGFSLFCSNNPFTQSIYASSNESDADILFVKQQCYRTCVIYHLRKTLVMLDGIAVTNDDRLLSNKKMRKLRSIANGKERFYLDSDLGPDTIDDEMDEDAIECVLSPFKNWKPVSMPLSSLLKTSLEDIQVQIRTPMKLC